MAAGFVELCGAWQAGGAAMAKACQGEQGGEASFSLWEAETCIKAADLLLWPHIKQAKQTGAPPNIGPTIAKDYLTPSLADPPAPIP